MLYFAEMRTSSSEGSTHAAMRRKLPEYMIPGILRQVEAMPLTKNGKIDRKALAELTGGKRG